MPLLHGTVQPQEWIGTDPGDDVHLFSDHVVAFAMTPEGDMLFLRATDWMTIELEGRFGPKAGLLAAMSGPHRDHRLFALDAAHASRLAATSQWIFAIVTDTTRRRHVRAFRNPLHHSSGEGEC
jgi:hypothetical protein